MRGLFRIVLAVGLFGPAFAGQEPTPDREQPSRQSLRRPQTPPGRAVLSLDRLPPDLELIRDVEFRRIDGRALRLNILRPRRMPERPVPAIIYIHGGGWRAGSKDGPQNIPLARAGYFTVSIDYRLSDEARFPAQIEDCKAAVRWVRAHAKEYNVDPERIGVWGHSAGGHLAALLGTSGGVRELEGDPRAPDSSRVQAVVDCFGPTDLVAAAGRPGGVGRADSAVGALLGGPVGENLERARAASPVTYVSRDDPPFLILHGERDMLVPIAQSELLAEKLREAGVDVTFVRVRNAGHGWGGGAEPSVEEIQRMIVGFFNKHLRGGPATRQAGRRVGS